MWVKGLDKKRIEEAFVNNIPMSNECMVLGIVFYSIVYFYLIIKVIGVNEFLGMNWAIRIALMLTICVICFKTVCVVYEWMKKKF